MPCQNVDRRVVVGVGVEPAGTAHKHRLGRSVCFSDKATDAAGLRRVGRIHLRQDPGLVAKVLFQLPQTAREDGVVESGLGFDIGARFRNRAFGGLGHGIGLQIFHHHSLRRIGDPATGLMRVVVPDASPLAVQLGQLPGYSAPTVGALLLALQGPLLAFDVRVQGWACRSCGGHGHCCP